MKNVVVACWFFCSVSTALPQVVPISNLSQPTHGYYSAVDSADLQAISFTTGDTEASLSSISVALPEAIVMPGTGNNLGVFFLSVNENDSGSPGADLTVLSGVEYPTNGGVYTFSNTTPFTLMTNTTYWIVAKSPQTTGDDDYYWSLTPSNALEAGSFWSLGMANSDGGSGWVADENYFLFSVTVADPILPAISISQPVLLIFPSTDFPFVLQQTSNLATSNWVTVTNAILSGVLSNKSYSSFLPPRNNCFTVWRWNRRSTPPPASGLSMGIKASFFSTA